MHQRGEAAVMNQELLKLAEQVRAGSGTDNALDVLIEVALFQPDPFWIAARPNDAGTKVIFTSPGGAESTHWACDWTRNRAAVASILKARALSQSSSLQGSDNVTG
jgi:hypothetical protein